jgi:hypothetical protein
MHRFLPWQSEQAMLKDVGGEDFNLSRPARAVVPGPSGWLVTTVANLGYPETSKLGADLLFNAPAFGVSCL